MRAKTVPGISILALACLWAGTAWAQGPAAGSASGQLVVDGKAVALRHAYLFTGPDSFDKHKDEVFVLLRDQPLDAGEIAAARSVGALRGKNSLLFQLHANRSYYLIIDHATLADEALSDSGPPDFRIQFQEFGRERVKGSAEQAESGFPKGHRVAYQVTFEAALARSFPVEPKLAPGASAKTLGPGGGEPGKAYLESCKSDVPKDVPELEKQLAARGGLPTDADLEELSKAKGKKVTRQEVLEELLELARAFAALKPSGCRVLGGTADDRTAVLDVEATVMGSVGRARVTMIREDGKWQVKETGSWTPK